MGKISTTLERRLTSAFTRSNVGFVDQILVQSPIGKNEKANRLALVSSKSFATSGKPGAKVWATSSNRRWMWARSGLGEDRLDRRRDHLGLLLWHQRQSVAHEMHLAALPGGTDEDLPDFTSSRL